MSRSPEVSSWPRQWVLLCNLLLLLGCSRDLPIDLPYEGPRLVMQSLLSPDRPFQARIDRTYPPTGNSQLDTAFAGATVLIYQDNQLLDTLRYVGHNQYRSPNDRHPLPGHRYRLAVTAPGYPLAESADESIPNAPRLGTLSITKPADYEIDVEVIDIPNQTNWYAIELAGTYQRTPLAINVNNLSRPDAISDNCGFRKNSTTFFYRDLCFTNGSLSARYGSSLEGTPQLINDRPPLGSSNTRSDSLTVYVRNVTEAYWQYYRYLPLEGLDQAFQPPATRYSNVRGGYGIVAAYHELISNQPVNL